MENKETIKSSVQQSLPNSTAVLVLGICSIALFCCMYGLIGLSSGLIALVLAKKASQLYNSSPESYFEGSFKNMKAGKICAIIGICLSGLLVIVLLINLAVYGTIALKMWEGILNQNF